MLIHLALMVTPSLFTSARKEGKIAFRPPAQKKSWPVFRLKVCVLRIFKTYRNNKTSQEILLWPRIVLS